MSGRREQSDARAERLGSLRRAAGLLVVNLALACLITSRLGWSWDLNPDGRYTLSDTSTELASSFQDNVLVRAFVPRYLPPPFHDHHQQIRARLERFSKASGGRIRVEMVDPSGAENASAEAERLGLAARSFTARQGGEELRGSFFLGIALFYQDRQEVIPALTRLDDLEFQISRRLRDLRDGRNPPRVGVVAGHGEIDLVGMLERSGPGGNMAQLLAQTYDLVRIELGRDRLDDLEALLVLGPRELLRQRHLFELDQFVCSGRPMALFFSALVPEISSLSLEPARHGLDRLLGPWGIQFGMGTMIDRAHHGQIRLPMQQGDQVELRPVATPIVPVVADLAPNHPVTRHLRSLVMPIATPLARMDGVAPLLESDVVARSADTASWIEQVRSLDPRAIEQPGPGEQPGPFTTAMALVGSIPSGFSGRLAPPPEYMDLEDEDGRQEVLERSPAGTRLAVVGSTEAAIANPGLLPNILDWLTEDDLLLSVRPRPSAQRPLTRLEGSSLWAVRAAVVGWGAIPLLVLLAWVRRQR